MVFAAVPAPSQQVEMWFDGPGQQRRWTVLIRLILAIPQAIVLAILEIALLVVTIIGWFGALVMGRLPRWVYQFNSGYVRWYTRYTAYVYLLTDEYPPFEFDDLPYPVRPIIAPPGTLNRLAVLFRIILGIPAIFFQVIVNYGLILPLLLVAWLITLFSGRMPGALYWAYSSWVRYSTRVMAYMLLITAEYPWGMLGDRGSEAPSAFAPPPAPPAASPWTSAPPPPATGGDEPASTAAAQDVAEEGANGGPAETAEAPGQPAAPAVPPPAPGWPPPPPMAPPTWPSAPPPTAPPLWDPAPVPTAPGAVGADRSRLSLPPAARKWLVFAIVWGSILFVAQVSVQAIAAGRNLNTSVGQYNTVVGDFNAQKAAVDNAVATAQRCSSVQCLRASHLAAARSLEKFDSDLTAMQLSCSAANEARSVESDLTQMATAFTDLANSTDAQGYRATVRSSNLNALFQSLPNDTNNLLRAMQASDLGSVCIG